MAATTDSNPESTATRTEEPRTTPNFLRDIIAEDVRTKKYGDATIQTRFPPEPNGYLHIGHAKAICLDFGLADEVGGRTNLRFDDTNPEKEEQEYVDSIQADVRWLGFEWERLCYASDYFHQLYDWAIQLIKAGKAYVDDLTADEIRQYRGTLTEPGKNSPYRDRSVEENLDLFTRMKAGEFPDGTRVLRAKIDMASPNINMRDPIMYRILHAEHHRTGNEWCIYPMYDYAHGQSDSIEQVTHSMCTLEFADHQPLYKWFIENLGIFPSQQIEFDRLNLTYTMLSKRKLLQLVNENRVSGWDDPRMPTLNGIRRRGFTPEALRAFCGYIGATRTNGTTDIEVLEHFQRDDLNKRASRAMAVLRPLKLVITNYPEGQTEHVEVQNNPEDPTAGTRQVPFSREIYIEQDDFREVPPPKYYRLSPGKEVRLRSAYFVTAQSVVKDDAGNITEVHCTYDPASRGGNSPDGRKVKSTMHWVSAAHALTAEVRLYDKLFSKPDPYDFPEGGDLFDNLNPNSLEVITDAKLEPSLAAAKPGAPYQFERVGYFTPDPDSTADKLVFNRTLPLKDSWAKIEKKTGA
ncbi:glutamine--tRNA ligase/YqeY domain fusion protein [Occallatibacter riparius]|uniref:Glutamine--tRNA ligase n=1 Tax=Occallatibacter riparius TaxID=1002689 RepID=A0A9J7BVA4_9BACT|nr:glutamine--tRNA ligase/YqeY domain fusion protein [Occallatibacter riparius]UWZ86607.1 glutamine--tRNA ligase/YqeY domain fusion protein [Occallatibacter riparius]